MHTKQLRVPLRNETAGEQYDNFKDWLINEDIPEKHTTGLMLILNNIVNYMMKDDKSVMDWFCEYTKELDKLRNPQNY